MFFLTQTCLIDRFVLKQKTSEAHDLCPEGVSWLEVIWPRSMSFFHGHGIHEKKFPQSYKSFLGSCSCLLWICFSSNVSERLPGRATNNRAEIHVNLYSFFNVCKENVKWLIRHWNDFSNKIKFCLRFVTCKTLNEGSIQNIKLLIFAGSKNCCETSQRKGNGKRYSCDR